MQIIFIRNLFLSVCLLGGILYLFQLEYFTSLLNSWNQVEYFRSNFIVPNLKYNNLQPREQVSESFRRDAELNDKPNLIWYKGRFDKSRQYRIYEWVWTSKKWDVLMEKFNVCLATQTSIEKVHWILESLEKWRGPMSVGVFLINYKEFRILEKMVTFARKCSADFANYVTIHVAFPANFKLPEEDNNKLGLGRLMGFNCNQTKIYFEYLLRINPVTESEKVQKLIYPQNHMRNVARKTCGTDWVYSTDVDIISSHNSAEKLQEFYRSPQARGCKKCAYVIPSFELVFGVEFPKTKMDLVNYARQNTSQPLHIKYHKTGHIATNYSKWMNSSLQEGPIQISHFINNSKVYYYEPFYVSSDSIPEFDERFVGYGYTRSSQIDEAMISGWNFSVLTPIFGVHWGMKDQPVGFNESLTSPLKNARDRQDATNFIKYIELMDELELKRGLSNRSSFGYDLKLKDKRSILVNLLLELRQRIRLDLTKTKLNQKPH